MCCVGFIPLEEQCHQCGAWAPEKQFKTVKQKEGNTVDHVAVLRDPDAALGVNLTPTETHIAEKRAQQQRDVLARAQRAIEAQRVCNNSVSREGRQRRNRMGLCQECHRSLPEEMFDRIGEECRECKQSRVRDPTPPRDILAEAANESSNNEDTSLEGEDSGESEEQGEDAEESEEDSDKGGDAAVGEQDPPANNAAPQPLTVNNVVPPVGGACPVTGCKNKKLCQYRDKIRHLLEHSKEELATINSEWWKLPGNQFRRCAKCGTPFFSVKNYSVQLCREHRQKGRGPRIIGVIEEQQRHLVQPVAPNEVDESNWRPPVSWQDLATLKVPVLESIPRSIRQQCASSLWTSLAGPVNERTCWALYAFAKLVLRLPLLKRGGIGDRSRTILRRAMLFSSREFDTLWVEAKRDEAAAASRVPPDAPEGFPLPEDDLDLPWGAKVSPLTPNSVPAPVAKRATRIAKQGQYSRAMQALSQAAVAPMDEETAQALRDLHPQEVEPVLPPLSDNATQIDDLDADTVLAVLRSFPMGSSGGASRMTPRLLHEICAAPGTLVAAVIGRHIAAVANGAIPVGIRPFLYGARLCALKKDNGGVRPLAAGEVVRRAAGKVVVRQCANDLKALLLPLGQTCVAVSGGLEAILHTVRRFNAFAAPEVCMLKIDIVNAFNSIHRQQMVGAVDEFCPALARYVHGAYGQHTHLFFGQHVLSSQCGVQQGDPCGMALFSLLWTKFWVDAPRNNLLLNAWFADDGIVGGSPNQVDEILVDFEFRGPAFGLRVNLEKCEVAGDWEDRPNPLTRVTKQFSRRQLTLLGASVGDAVQMARYADVIGERISKQTLLLAEVPDPHVACTLLRFCAGFAMSVYFMRAMGEQDVWKRVDNAVEAVLDAKIGALTPEAIEELRLPIRGGGSGYRATSWHAAPAFIAASTEAGDMVTKFLNSEVELPTDPLLDLAKASPILAQFHTAATLVAGTEQDGNRPKHRTQKELSDAVETDRAKRILENAPHRTRCRLASSAAKGASAWVIASPDVAHHLWLGPAEFRSLMRLRHGLSLRENECVCPNCGTAVADAWGDHVTTCLNTGLRAKAHYDLCGELVSLMSYGLMAPQREVTPFPAHAGKRLDIAAKAGFHGKVGLIDVAITHALRANVLRPGDAATEYERVKVLEYGELVEPRTQVLVPCIVDTFGAWGASARYFLRTAARMYAARHGEGKVGEAIFYARLNGTLMRSIAPALVRLAAVDGPVIAPAHERDVGRLTGPEEHAE